MKYEVTTEFGTFKRGTARTYTHLVIWQGVAPLKIASDFDAEQVTSRKHLAQYEAAEQLARETGMRVEIEDGSSANSAQWLRANNKPRGTMRTIAESDAPFLKGWSAEQWAVYAESMRERISTNAVRKQSALLANERAEYMVAGWCGRLDLAVKLAEQQRKYQRQNIRIMSAETGLEVPLYVTRSLTRSKGARP